MITKIKMKEGVEIHTEESAGKAQREIIFKCAEGPHPDFKQIFVRLEKVARQILEVPDDVWAGQMTINQVSFSFSESTGVPGAVLSGRVEIETSNSPFTFNTPHLPFSQYSPTGEAPLMPQEGVELLERCREEAEAYMKGGKRAQLELLKS